MIDNVSEAYIKRSLALLRAAEGDAIEVARVLGEIHKRIIASIDKKYLTLYNMGQVESISDSIKKELETFYKDYFPKEFLSISSLVIEKELAWNIEAIAGLIDKKTTDLLKPAYKKTIKSAATKPYQGKTFDQWLNGAFVSNVKQIDKTLKTSFIEGKSISEVVVEINKINRRALSDTKALTRAFFMHNAVEAKQRVFDLNPDVVEGSIWISTLDSRTTPLICGIRDHKEYDRGHNPVGHSLPYLDGAGRAHFGCRSIEIPKLKGVDVFMNRRAVVAGDKYERGDNLTRNGTVRKPTKDARDKEIFGIVQTTTVTDYEKFLKAQANKNIDYVADILKSKEDAILFRDGKVSLLQLSKENPVYNPTNRNRL
jgi:hypothetical protein